MLIDKGYYDYDYEAPKGNRTGGVTKAKSDEETAKMLSRFGVGTAANADARNVDEVDLKGMDADALQAYAIADAKAKAKTGIEN